MDRPPVDRSLRGGVGTCACAAGLALGLVTVCGLLTMTAAASAQRQTGEPATPTCEVACRVNPFTAPASCDCNASGNRVVEPAPVDPVPQIERAAPPAPAAPSCETACRVNPVTAPPDCECSATAVPPPVADSVIVGGGGPGGGPGGAEPLLDDPVTPNDILDLMLVSYEREVAKVDNYYFVETTDIIPRPTVRYFEKEVEAGRSIFKEVPLAELAKREQLADPTLSAQDRAIAERPQVLLGELATAFDGIARMLGAEDAAKPFTDGLRTLEADLDAEMGGLGDSADDVGGLLGPEAEALFRRHATPELMAWGDVHWDTADGTQLVPGFGSPSSDPAFRMRQRNFREVYEGTRSTRAVGTYINEYPCYILRLPRDRVVDGFPHRLVSADMWICALGRGVMKPVRTRVEYLTNAGDASVGDAVAGGSRPVVIDQISFAHLTVGSMQPFQKFVQSVSGLTDDLRIIRKLRRNFTVNKTPKDADIVEAVGEDFGKVGVID